MHKRPGHFGRGTARIMLKDQLWNTGRIFSACLTGKTALCILALL